MKLVEKVRLGRKVRKKYDTAQTPFQRVLASAQISQEIKDELRQLYLGLNPVVIRRRMEARLEQLWELQR